MAVHQFADTQQPRVPTSTSFSILEGDDNDLLTVREVAKLLRVDDTTVRRWIKNGALEAVTLPHRGARQAYRIKRRTVRLVLTPQLQVPSAQ